MNWFRKERELSPLEYIKQEYQECDSCHALVRKETRLSVTIYGGTQMAGLQGMLAQLGTYNHTYYYCVGCKPPYDGIYADGRFWRNVPATTVVCDKDGKVL